MSIEQTLIEIRDELRAIRAVSNIMQSHPVPAAIIPPVPAPIPPVPSTVGAALLPIVPEGPAATLVDPTIAFGQPAPLPANVVPIAAPPTGSPAPAGEVDVSGLPWDARIHASSKAKVADGTWRLKRGVDNDLVTSVTAELKAVMSLPTPTGPGTTTHVGGVPVPGVPGVPVPPVITFELLMIKLGQMLTAKTVTQEAINTACLTIGVTIPTLAARPDLVPELAEKLGVTP